MRVGMRGAEPGVGQPAGLAKAQREQGAGRAEVQNPGIELVDVVAPAVFGEKRVEAVRRLLVPAGRPDCCVASVAHLHIIAPALRPVILLENSTSHHITSCTPLGKAVSYGMRS